MSSSLCDNDKGFSLLEAVIAIFLTTVALMAILSMQPMAWKASAKSDYMGRAAGILYQELQKQEVYIMNPNNTVTVGEQIDTPVYTSGVGTTMAGDATFLVTTKVENVTTISWRVTVTVKWTGHAKGITESIIVMRQESFTRG